jgi:hypothetical protein
MSVAKNGWSFLPPHLIDEPPVIPRRDEFEPKARLGWFSGVAGRRPGDSSPQGGLKQRAKGRSGYGNGKGEMVQQL